MIAIKYIGHRPVYTDGACGSGLTFEKGQTLNIEDEFATRMLRHPSVYERSDAFEQPEQQPSKPANSHTDDSDPDQTTRDAIANMTKGALVTYAKTHFSLDLDRKMSVADMRSKVTGLFDQFGTE